MQFKTMTANRLDSDDWTTLGSFATFEEACDFVAGKRAFCVVCENGTFRLNGEDLGSLITIHWNTPVTKEWGTPPGSGFGYPHGNPSKLVAYKSAEATNLQPVHVEAAIYAEVTCPNCLKIVSGEHAVKVNYEALASVTEQRGFSATNMGRQTRRTNNSELYVQKSEFWCMECAIERKRAAGSVSQIAQAILRGVSSALFGGRR